MADKLINVLAAVTLLEMMISLGLGLNLSTVLEVGRNSRLIARAMIASYFLVPALAVGLLLAFDAKPMVAAGLLIVAVCPGAPYGPPLTNIAKGDVSTAVGLMLVLAATSALFAPLLLRLLLPIVAGNAVPAIDISKLIRTLVGTQLLPLCVGLLVRKYVPCVADRLIRPASILSLALNLVTLLAVLIVYFSMLASIRARGYLGMLCLLLGCVLVGAAMRGSTANDLKAMVISTSVRNAGVSLVVATTSFVGTPAVTSATAYALFQTVAMAGIALLWGKATPRVTVVKSKAA